MNNAFVNAAVNSETASKVNACTANGALTRGTSGQSALDLFSMIGSARNAQTDAVNLFSKAYGDNKELALRIALWARDVRGGAGERQVFRNIIGHLEKHDPVVLQKLTPFVPEYGRYDDIIKTVNVDSFTFKVAADELLGAIKGGNALAAKWTPRKGPVAVKLRQLWGMSPKYYRKFLVRNTNVVETAMCSGDWNSIEFDKLPSVAGLRYQKAFGKHATERYEAYKQALVKGEAKINASTLFPHNIVANIRIRSGDVNVMNAQWAALPNYLGDRSNKVLCMCDVSDSMDTNIGGSVRAMDVSIALGLYTSERLSGAFKDVILTFSGEPQFHKVTGNSIAERVSNLERAHWDMNTDLQKAFVRILGLASANRVPAKDMPDTLLIISDMEFDACTSRYSQAQTNFDGIKEKYEAAGYTLPKIVFWNVNGRAGNNPVKYNEQGTAMVSGFSPAILDTVLTGKEFDPMTALYDAVMKERYDIVSGILAM